MAGGVGKPAARNLGWYVFTQIARAPEPGLPHRKVKQESSSFLKKRTKKLLLPSVPGERSGRVNQQSKSFLVLFFKKELLPYLPVRRTNSKPVGIGIIISSSLAMQATMADVHEVYPYLRVHNTGEAIDFYVPAFGAQELFRLTEPSGRIGHAEIKLGPATLMLADENPAFGTQGPHALGGTSFSIHLHVDNADSAFEQAVQAGATVVRALQDQFYGKRSGTVRDPFGHEWLIGAHIEDVSTEEMPRRYTALFET